jgi:TPR repeat protein
MSQEDLDIFRTAELLYESDSMNEAIRSFKVLSERGMPKASRYLGLIFRTGDGVDKDMFLSSKYYGVALLQFENASESGDKDSSLALAKIYQYGDQIAKNETLALRYYRKAIRQGSSEGMLRLAHCYKYGWCGVGKDADKFTKYFSMAISNNNAEAYYEMGCEYLGFDNSTAVNYFHMALRFGYSLAEEEIVKLNRDDI